MRLRACSICGAPTIGRRCRAHLEQRRGSTRQWRKLRALVLARDGYICHWCTGPATHVDHLTPVARGGTDHPSNLVAACADCNLRRGAGRAA
jgi:5-methylcytosine-specific restriction endonuclease McrA